ncbi:hypothetical protein NGTWS0302_37460 [Mycolicibacterium cyprinidarum]|uniref:PE-PPE domain-containing protein n=1 Tax=Mycolicibacterium cyprinidarum TaxID=2860311 RepID=A0ABQ4VCK3_9MYCO|nr:hypothetical protein NGTWS0302_37460 [Mycolicibacterium sp. NGTWS0302]GJF17027.1 hypothetical protein NGTWS1702_22830 [Mycolicibacterium sp. NGTWSNA01]
MLLFGKGTLVNRAIKAAMTAALPFMALPLTMAGPLPVSAAAVGSSASADLIPPGPATVLHTSPTPWSIPNALDGVLCADARVCQEVYYQAIQSYGPIELGLAENVKALDFAINHTSGDKVVTGFSGGARVVSKWLQEQADSGEAPLDGTNIVLLGNSGRKYGGLNGFFWGSLFDMLMTPTDTDYNVLDVARQFDPISDFPDNPFNLLALANAWAGFTNVHLTYSQADLDAPGNYVWKEGNTTYVYIPTAHLPILQGLRDVGLGALADQWEAPLRKIIDTAYTRDYLENATVTPEPAAEDESTNSVQAASSTAAAVQAASSTAAADTGTACSGYRTDGCDILAEQTYTPVTAPDLENPAMQNILPNLFNALMGIPRAYLDGLNDLSHALEVTGSWWVYTPTNVLGYDPADPPKITAVTNLMIPFKALSNPLGEHVSWWAKANLPMNAGCTGTAPPACSDANAILSKMFLAPIWDLNSGYQFPELNNPVSDAEGAVGEEIPGEEGPAVPWSGAAVQLNPMDATYSVINYLLAPPEQNKAAPITFAEVVQTISRLGAAVWEDFNPFVPGSYLWKGYPYTLVTPFIKPFVRILCPQCDPEHPEDPTPFVDDEVPPSSESTGSSVTTLMASSTAKVGDEEQSEEATTSTTEDTSGDVTGTDVTDANVTVDEDTDVVSEAVSDAESTEAPAEDAADTEIDETEATDTEAEDVVGADTTEDAEADEPTGADTEKGADEVSDSDATAESGSTDESATVGGTDDSESTQSTSQDNPSGSTSGSTSSGSAGSGGSGGGDD